MVTKLKQQGFSKIVIEGTSLKITPTFLHIPFAIIGFTLIKLLKTITLKIYFSQFKRIILCLSFWITH